MNALPGDGVITEILHRWSQGDRAAIDDVIPIVYQELRRMARLYLSHERDEPLAQPTEIVHEFVLRVLELEQPNWRDRSHFFGAAARSMRRILVDRARKRRAGMRDGVTIPLGDIELIDPARLPVDCIHDALERLAEMDPLSAQIVELRYFGGLTIEEAAAVLDTSPTTVKRNWTAARLWLLRELRG